MKNVSRGLQKKCVQRYEEKMCPGWHPKLLTYLKVLPSQYSLKWCEGCTESHNSCVMRKPVSVFFYQVRHKPGYRITEMALGIRVKTKAQNNCAVTSQLICAFVFGYVKSRFSHDADEGCMAEKIGKVLNRLPQCFLY